VDNGERARGHVTPAELPELSRRHFPLCMSQMMRALGEAHHLHNQGRLQLGLFLKSIGLSMEDALLFWRREFAPRIPAEKFEKEYAYDVRYSYGKEGNRKDYTAYGCMKLITTPVGDGQQHGCPYKTFSEPQLRAALSRMACNEDKIEAAVAKARAKHYQLACAAAFEGVSGCACDVGVNHPTQYYEESRRMADERAAREAGGAPPGTPVALGAAQVAGTPGGGAARAGFGGGRGGPAETPASRFSAARPASGAAR